MSYQVDKIMENRLYIMPISEAKPGNNYVANHALSNKVEVYSTRKGKSYGRWFDGTVWREITNPIYSVRGV